MDKELMAGFVEEVRGYLPQIEESLSSWRDHQDAAGFEQAHRHLHTIKGAGAMLGVTGLSRMAGYCETLLDDIQAGALPDNDRTRSFLDGVLTRIGFSVGRLLEPLADDGDLVKAVDHAHEQYRRGEWPDFPEPRQTGTASVRGDDREPAARVRDPELEAVFRQEADEHLQTILAQLSSMEEHGRPGAWLSSLRRTVHTLKGSAAVAGYAGIAQLCHRWEDLLEHLADGRVALDSGTRNLLYETTVCIEERLSAQATADDPSMAAILARFDHVLPVDSAEGARERVSRQGGSDAAGAANQVAEIASGELVARDSEPEMAEAVGSAGASSLRVSLGQMDELVRLTGELVINRSSFEQYQRRLVQSLDEWQPGMSRLTRLVQRLETEYEASSLKDGDWLSRFADRPDYSDQGGFEQGQDFDPLEMDRYTQFHLLTRELTEAVNDIRTIGADLREIQRDFESYFLQSTRLSGELQDRLMDVRMIDLEVLGPRLLRTVQMTAAPQGKAVNFEMNAGEVKLDKAVLEELVDPLLHVLRNSVDHGIETAPIRQALGKPDQGTIRLDAFYAGTQAVIRITDDGSGVNLDDIRQHLRVRGVNRNVVEGMSQAALLATLFEGGFSTAGQISDISGRGFGLDVVRDKIARLKGGVSLDNQPGQSFSVSLRLPLSMAVIRVLLVRVEGEIVALPLNGVQQVLKMEERFLEKLSNEPVVSIDGQYVPMIYLGSRLGITRGGAPTWKGKPGVVFDLGEQQCAVVVDDILEEREVVVKNLGEPLRQLDLFMGATLLGDGRVVLILEPTRLTREQRTEQRMIREPSSSRDLTRPKQILIVDDSLSVRHSLAKMVGKAGYQVHVAKDGVEALEWLQEAEPQPDLVLLDIEMPRMNGFEFTRLLRNNAKWLRLPIVILTSRDTEKHRRRARELGADAFLIKPVADEILTGVLAEQLAAAPVAR